jgi:hypothetical protein
MPYGLLNHMLTGGQITDKYKKTLTLLDNFGYRDNNVEIFTCYNPANPVRSLDKNVKLMTIKLKNQYLLCVGNTEMEAGELNLDLSRLGMKKPYVADAISKEILASTQKLKGKLPYHGYRLIIVADSIRELQNALKRTNP